MTLPNGYAAFSRWQSSDYTDTDAAAILSDIVGWNVAEHYAHPLTDTVFWDGELEFAVLAA
jgi:hypothetical protein